MSYYPIKNIRGKLVYVPLQTTYSSSKRKKLHLCDRIYKNVFGEDYICTPIFAGNIRELKEGHYVFPEYIFFREIFKKRSTKYLPVFEKEGFILRNKDYDDILIIMYCSDKRYFSEYDLYLLLDKIISEKIEGLYYPTFLISKSSKKQFLEEILSNINVKEALRQKTIHIIHAPSRKGFKNSIKIAKILNKRSKSSSIYKLSKTTEVLYCKLQ